MYFYNKIIIVLVFALAAYILIIPHGTAEGQAPGDSLHKEYRVVDIISTEIPDGSIKRNVYVDWGAGSGAKKETLMQVFRELKTPSGIFYRVRLGTLRIEETFRNVSSALIIELAPDSILSVLKYKTVMVDDIAVPVFQRKLTLHFTSNSFNLDLDIQRELESIMERVKTFQNANILIEGHTDNQGDTEYNIKLSLERALAIKDIIVKMGVDSSYIKTFGHGDRYPITSNDTDEGKTQNRRVEVTVTGEF